MAAEANAINATLQPRLRFDRGMLTPHFERINYLIKVGLVHGKFVAAASMVDTP
jgi:hypothetical protein